MKLNNAGVSGFGRFGLHLLKYLLDRLNQSNFSISYINDEVIDIKQALEIIVTDKFLDFSK